MQARIAFTASSSILIFEDAFMGIVKRQLGDRRLGFPLEFPLVDSDDVLVCSDRRMPQERRKANITLEDIELLLSQMQRRESSRG
jgi:hypothetical protein